MSKCSFFFLLLFFLLFAGCAGQSKTEVIPEPNDVESVTLNDYTEPINSDIVEPTNSPESTIRIPFSAEELCGQKCSETKEKLEIIGFNHIYIYDAHGKLVSTTKDSDIVGSIKIGSNSTFSLGDEISTSQHVMITIRDPRDAAQDNSTDSAEFVRFQRNGFDPRTNWTKALGNCTFSIPSYYQEAEDKGSENAFLLFTNDTSSPADVLFSMIEYDNTTISPEFSDTLIDASLSLLGDVDFDNKTVDVIQLQDYDAMLVRSDVYQDDGQVFDIYLAMYFVSPNRFYRIYLIQMKDSRFDYSNDFLSMIKSVVIHEDEAESHDDNTIAHGNVGDSYIEVVGWELKTDYSGKPVIVLTFDWTNNSKKTTNAASELMVRGFQGGVALDIGFLLDSSVDTGSALRDIKPGTTITVQEVFTLYDSMTVVEFEITELFSLSREAEALEFSIPLGNGTYNDTNTGNDSESIEESGNNPDAIAQGYAGKDYIEVLGWRIVKDYTGKPALVLTFNWTNNSEETTNAAFALRVEGFQGGIETDYGILLDSSVDTGSMIRDIKPGTTITVDWAITLYDTETDVELEISDFGDWYGKSKTLAFTIHLK